MRRSRTPTGLSRDAERWAEIGFDLLAFARSLVLGSIIFGLFLWAITSPRPRPATSSECSPATLSTPDGKLCFPKYHDRSRFPAEAGDRIDEGAADLARLCAQAYLPEPTIMLADD